MSAGSAQRAEALPLSRRGAWPALSTLQIIFIMFGFACRIAQYAADTSIWHDEAYVALNAMHKSYAELLGPLEWNEAAPPLFLACEKAIIDTVGRPGYALRAIPLLAGLVSLIVIAGLANKVLGPSVGSAAAVGFLAVSDKLIDQANEAKHFTFDTLIAAAMLWLAIGALAAHRRVARIVGFGLIASIVMWLSYASIFVFAGAIGVLGVLALRQRDWRVVAACAVSAALVGISLMALMTVVKAQATPELMNFWKGRLIGAQTVSGMLLWIPAALAGISDYLLSPTGPLLLLLAVVGAAQLWVSSKSLEVSILLSPLVAAMAASLANRWPFGGNQHMVFAAATVFILAGNGFAVVAEALWARRRLAAVAFVVAVAAPPTAIAGYHLVVPRYRHEARTVIEFAERNQRPDDAMIVACPAEYEFYTGRKPPNVPATAKTRVWFIGTRSGKRPFPSQAVIDQLASRRPKLAAIEAPGAGAYLFGPETPASAVRQ